MLQKLFCRLSIMPLASIVLLFPLDRALHAQSKPAVGSPNVAIADPPLPVPSTKPCTVQLFPKQDLGPRGENTRMDSVPQVFNYQPPDGCKGPWAKVVLVGDFSVDPGHQYDRTASIWVNNLNIYFGTTQEPGPDFGPSWRIERDLTDYSSLLRSPGSSAAAPSTPSRCASWAQTTTSRLPRRCWSIATRRRSTPVAPSPETR